MDLRSLIPWRYHRCHEADDARLVGQSALYDQTIVIEGCVIRHVSRYRQLQQHSLEAGGQLFGYISNSGVNVTLAAGPYYGDHRGPFSYRSNPKRAQRIIARNWRRGLFYVGEWHTHRDDTPTASGTDVDTMRTLVQRSQLNVSALLLLIVGLTLEPPGIALYSCDGDQFVRWQIHVHRV